jgi:hypothetical protein
MFRRVTPEERDTMFLEVLFVLVEHTIKPRKQLFGAMIGVQDDWNSVDWSNGTDIMCSGNGTGDTRFLVLVGNAFAW